MRHHFTAVPPFWKSNCLAAICIFMYRFSPKIVFGCILYEALCIVCITCARVYYYIVRLQEDQFIQTNVRHSTTFQL